MNETKKDKDNSIYEVGYHLIPTIEEGDVLTEVLKIKTLIEENDGLIIAEELPKMIPLAYEISKSIGSKKQDFNKAYFGFIKLEVEPSKIDSIKIKLETFDEVLRFIIIKTVRENTLFTPKIPMFKKELKKEEKETCEVSADQPKVSEEEIDKSIDELLIS